MSRHAFVLHPAAKDDLVNIWLLVYRNDGSARADGVIARIEAFVRSLEEFPHVGRAEDSRRPGLRTVSIPKLRKSVVVFRVAQGRGTVLRIGYLGANVIETLPDE